MTNKEFDEILERTNAVVCNREWYERAAKALEQEEYYKDLAQSYERTIVKLTEAIAERQPNEDCVSRQVVIETIDDCNSDGLKGIFCSYDDGERFKKYIKNLPSVTPTQRWIPISERLPEEMGTYMTTIDYGEHGLVTGQRYYYGRGLKWNDECVIAWQPLPEPYKEMESEE